MHWRSNRFRSGMCHYYGTVIKKNVKQTVTSRIAQWGTDIPEGTGFGNLETKLNVKLESNISSTLKLTVQEVV